MRTLPLVVIAALCGCSRSVDVDEVLTLTIERRETSAIEKVLGVPREIQKELNDRTILVIQNTTEHDISPLAVCAYDPETDRQATWTVSYIDANRGRSFPIIELTPEFTHDVEVDWKWKAEQVIRLAGNVIYRSDERPGPENNYESKDVSVYFTEQREIYRMAGGTLGIRKTDRKVDWEPNEWYPQ